MNIEIKKAPTWQEFQKWQNLNKDLLQIENTVSGCRLYGQIVGEKTAYLNSFGIVLADNASNRFVKIDAEFQNLRTAIHQVNNGLLGARYRNNDFDILKNDAPLGAAFVPILIGSVVVAGCIALLHKLGKEADEIAVQYKAISKEADNILCKDPASDMCKNWHVIKEAKKIEQKESFADKLVNVGKTALNIGLAVVIGVITLSIWRYLK